MKTMRRVMAFLSQKSVPIVILAASVQGMVFAQVATEPATNNSVTLCRVETTDYKGWKAQQLSNHWVKLFVVPQNGGRLMQVIFAGHPFLFVNPLYEGKYLPPTQSKWFNYGGDKLWLLPEGTEDEQHWAGGSDIIDDGPYTFRKISEGAYCEIELESPADPRTGIQFHRTIHLDSDSPRIRFHAAMKNTSGHTVEWSMQSVSQYNTGGLGAPPQINRDFHAFASANANSAYLNRYHVRFGPAENPAVSIRQDGTFTLRYVHMAAELWLDSTAGWLAVVDGSSRHGMVERFHYDESRPYPGKASVIFWTNGPELKLSHDGEPALTSGEDGSPYYMEAEVNSPLCKLQPGESCDLETDWFPTRAESELHAVTESGIVVRPLKTTRLENGKLKLSGTFGVFFPGHLVVHLYNEHGRELQTSLVANVDPSELVSLGNELSLPETAARLSVHLEDEKGLDRGSLQEVLLTSPE
jgi:hypothetical protein